MIDHTILKRIRDIALKLDWEVAFGGKSKGNQHLFRVNKIAKWLAVKEKSDLNLTLAAAWIHDVGLIHGNDNDPKTIAETVQKVLSELPLTNSELKAIAECAAAHEGDAQAMSLEAKIVHDADVLDKAGILGVIRHTWKIVNMINPQASVQELFTILKSHLSFRENNIYTKSGEKLISILNQQQKLFFADEKLALTMLEKISTQARMGVISDKIAESLIADFPGQITQNLKTQLDCTFLTN